SRRRHTRWPRDWSSDVCSSDLLDERALPSNSFTGLSAAGQFAVLGINGGDITIRNSDIVGSIGLAPNATSELRSSHVNGELDVRSEERRVGKECGARCGGGRWK